MEINNSNELIKYLNDNMVGIESDADGYGSMYSFKSTLVVKIRELLADVTNHTITIDDTYNSSVNSLEFTFRLNDQDAMAFIYVLKVFRGKKRVDNGIGRFGYKTSKEVLYVKKVDYAWEDSSRKDIDFDTLLADTLKSIEESDARHLKEKREAYNLVANHGFRTFSEVAEFLNEIHLKLPDEDWKKISNSCYFIR